MLPNYDTRDRGDRGDPYTSSKGTSYKGATDLSRFTLITLIILLIIIFILRMMLIQYLFY